MMEITNQIQISKGLEKYFSNCILDLGQELSSSIRDLHPTEYEVALDNALALLDVPEDAREEIICGAVSCATLAGIPYNQLSPLNQFIVAIPPYVLYCLEEEPPDPSLMEEVEILMENPTFPRHLQENLGLSISQQIKGPFWNPSLPEHMKKAAKHMVTIKNTVGSNSPLKEFPLLYLYFDTFMDISDAWSRGYFEVALHEDYMRIHDVTYDDVMKDEALFLKLYGNHQMRLKLDNGDQLRRDSEKYYWDLATHPEKYPDHLKLIESPQTDIEKEQNRLAQRIDTLVDAIKRRYGI